MHPISASILCVGVGFLAGQGTRPEGRCAAWHGPAQVLTDAQSLVASNASVWRTRRGVYDVRRARRTDVRLTAANSTCSQAVAAYTAAMAKGVSGPPDSVPLRLVVIEGPDFFLVEDSLSAVRNGSMYEVAVFGKDWTFRISFGAGA